MPLKTRGGAFDRLENLQEDAVLEKIVEVLTRREFANVVCNCDICLVDVAAIALNALPPRYVADRYNKFPMTAEQEQIEVHMVDEIVTDAVRKVSRDPHHGIS